MALIRGIKTWYASRGCRVMEFINVFCWYASYLPWFIDFLQQGIWDMPAQDSLSQDNMTWFRGLLRARGTTLREEIEWLIDDSAKQAAVDRVHTMQRRRGFGGEMKPVLVALATVCDWFVIWNCQSERRGRVLHMYIFFLLGFGCNDPCICLVGHWTVLSLFTSVLTRC